MSNYKNFVKDFPDRCRQLLEDLGPAAIERDREVTLTLSVLSTALLVPYERLRSGGLYDQTIGPMKAPSQVTSRTRVKDIVSALRNALAHGNIYSRGGNANQIVLLVFASGGKKRGDEKRKPRYRCIQVSPQDLQSFVLRWTGFLKRLRLPTDFIAGSLDDTGELAA